MFTERCDHSACPRAERWTVQGRVWGEGAWVGGYAVCHLVVLSLILWWLEQLLQDPDLLVGEISAVRLH